MNRITMNSLIKTLLRPNIYRNMIAIRNVNACNPKKKAKNPAFEKIKQLQEKFQKDDGKPIFLKGGTSDQILYRTTMGLAVLGLLLQVHFFICYMLGI